MLGMLELFPEAVKLFFEVHLFLAFLALDLSGLLNICFQRNGFSFQSFLFGFCRCSRGLQLQKLSAQFPDFSLLGQDAGSRIARTPACEDALRANTLPFSCNYGLRIPVLVPKR